MRTSSGFSIALLAAVSAASLAGCEHKSQSSDKAAAKSSKDSKPASGLIAGSGDSAKPAAMPPVDRTPPVKPMAPAGSVQPDAAAAGVRLPTAEDLGAFTKDIPGDGPKLIADIETSMGAFTCELHDKLRPLTVANFVGLATGKLTWFNPATKKAETGKPYYDGLTFHRVLPKFMVQGGDPVGNGSGGPGYKFADEFGGGLSNIPGSLAMANAGATTNGSQFFINEVDNSNLDPKHTVFGQCSPVELIAKITSVPKSGDPRRGTPATPVTITKVTIHHGK